MKEYRFIFEYADGGQTRVSHNLRNDRDARDDAAESFNNNPKCESLTVKNGSKIICLLKR
jgi:hypothetical protein